MRARNSPETAIFLICIIQADPNSFARERLGADVGVVLMGKNCASDLLGFEDVHGLDHDRAFEIEYFLADLFDSF